MSNTNDAISLKVGETEYTRHEDFFYDPSIPLYKLNSTTYIFGIKVRFHKTIKKRIKSHLKRGLFLGFLYVGITIIIWLI